MKILTFLAVAFVVVAPVAAMAEVSPAPDSLRDLNSIAGNMVSFSDLGFILSKIFAVIKAVGLWALDMSRGWIKSDVAYKQPQETNAVTVNNPSDVLKRLSDQGQGAKEQFLGVQSTTVQKIQAAKSGIGFIQSVLNGTVSFLDSAEKIIFAILH